MKVTSIYLFVLALLVSCNSNSGLIDNKVNPVPDPPQTFSNARSDNWLQLQLAYAEKREQGTDFYAFGEDWTLTIDEDKEIHFAADIGDIDFSAPGTKDLQPADHNATMYDVYTENGSLSIRLISDTCTNQKGEKMPFKVKVSHKNKVGEINSFNGCGLYLNNPVLNDIWALKSWNRYSDSLRTPGFPGNPFIEINLGTNRFSGNLGCGDVEGYIAPKGNKLKIYDLDYLNKSSDCDSKIAQDLFDYLNFKDHYVKIDDLKLRLATDSDTLVFQKVD